MQTKKILKQKMSDADEFEKFEQVVSETEQKYGALLEDDKFPYSVWEALVNTV